MAICGAMKANQIKSCTVFNIFKRFRSIIFTAFNDETQIRSIKF